MSDDACTIITVHGKEVARCPSADTGRPHNHQPRLAIVPWTEVIAQQHVETGIERHAPRIDQWSKGSPWPAGTQLWGCTAWPQSTSPG